VRIDHSDGLLIDGAKVSVNGCVITGALTGVRVFDHIGTRSPRSSRLGTVAFPTSAASHARSPATSAPTKRR